MIQILGRRTKNNPCLVGEPGVGKTAVAEGLAQRIAQGDVPETIEGKQVITLDMGLLVAGTKYRGEFEERLKKLMDEIKQNDEIILVRTPLSSGTVSWRLCLRMLGIVCTLVALQSSCESLPGHARELPAHASAYLETLPTVQRAHANMIVSGSNRELRLRVQFAAIPALYADNRRGQCRLSWSRYGCSVALTGDVTELVAINHALSSVYQHAAPAVGAAHKRGGTPPAGLGLHARALCLGAR